MCYGDEAPDKAWNEILKKESVAVDIIVLARQQSGCYLAHFVHFRSTHTTCLRKLLALLRKKFLYFFALY